MYKTLASFSLFNQKHPVEWCWSRSQTWVLSFVVLCCYGPCGPVQFCHCLSWALTQSTLVILTVRPNFNSKSWVELFESSPRWQTFQQRKAWKGWRKHVSRKIGKGKAIKIADPWHWNHHSMWHKVTESKEEGVKASLYVVQYRWIRYYYLKLHVGNMISSGRVNRRKSPKQWEMS